ncbi:MAG: hypothetical protein ACXAEU_03210 [Candidatus Hodarchaeales archaeon]|jgi:hypothetical protein
MKTTFVGSRNKNEPFTGRNMVLKTPLYSEKAILLLQEIEKHLSSGNLSLVDLIKIPDVRKLMHKTGEVLNEEIIDQLIRETVGVLRGKGRGKESLIKVERVLSLPPKINIRALTPAGKEVLNDHKRFQIKRKNILFLYRRKSIRLLYIIEKKLSRGTISLVDLIKIPDVRKLMCYAREELNEETVDRQIREAVNELRGKGRGKKALIRVERKPSLPPTINILALTPAGKVVLAEFLQRLKNKAHTFQ